MGVKSWNRGIVEGETGLELIESRKLEHKENEIMKINFKWKKEGKTCLRKHIRKNEGRIKKDHHGVKKASWYNSKKSDTQTKEIKYLKIYICIFC